MENELLYYVSNDEFFYADDSEKAKIRFRVTLDFDDNNNNRQFDAGIDMYKGIRVRDMGGYRWEI